MLHTASIDFGYPWWLSYGHLTLFIPAVAGLVAGRIRKWPSWLMAVLGLAAAWSGAALFVVRSFNVNSQADLPTENFLRSGTGRVLDIGAGTGRSSIMVLTARPQATLVALDLFGQSFDAHFGKKGTPQERLLANLKAAGVDQRASIVAADMRKLPFEPAVFDAAVSAYAIDHLGREGSKQSLVEANRILKPGGDFLLMLIANDRWTKFAFGPLLSHGGTRGAGWWRQAVQEAGFQVLEEGTAPATLYFLLRRP
jgi:ubiquinone/menaquinone biosynthesis C-methylase UbiE